ncbi:unnamed protein product [Hyaloperonospora brassicae]|uniref:BZIP domain-containing protein n=1 Tax=Hyaloperonospora brassicae TaxID=162125 RepID=A0AAV0SZ24_HYABA|nr:unnamed protein product [Hyaloperonospora brassicae]
MRSSDPFRAPSRPVPHRRWDTAPRDDRRPVPALFSPRAKARDGPPVASSAVYASERHRRPMASRDFALPAVPQPTARRWGAPPTETSPLVYDDPFQADSSMGTYGSRPSPVSIGMASRKAGEAAHGYRAIDALDCRPVVPHSTTEDYDSAARAFAVDYELEPQHSQTELQRYYASRQSLRAMNGVATRERDRRPAGHHELYAREMRGREEPLDDVRFGDHATRLAGLPRSLPSPASLTFGLLSSEATRDVHSRRYHVVSPPTAQNAFRYGQPQSADVLLEPATVEMYPADTSSARAPLRHEFTQEAEFSRQRTHQSVLRRPPPSYGEHPTRSNDMVMADRRSSLGLDLSRVRRDPESRPVYKDLALASPSMALNDDYRQFLPSSSASAMAGLSSGRLRQHSHVIARLQTTKRPRRPHDPFLYARPEDLALAPQGPTATTACALTPVAAGMASISSFYRKKDGVEEETALPKRRCGRKSMNYSSEQKRERNRAAVKKCRQRQALKLEYLRHKAESLTAENHTLSEMLIQDAALDDDQRTSLMRGIQMDILLKIKEVFTQSLPKDFVLDADSIWDLNSVLTVSMPSRCYYGVESIKDFWRTSLRMRNKGKIRSFWAWLFRLPPGDRFSAFEIQPFSPTSNLYFISWTTKSSPSLAGSMIIMFGDGHRVSLHVECFGWLIWRYLLTNEPFPDISLD